MATYETLFITPPTLTDEDEKTVVDTMTAIVTDGGGVFTLNERMGRRRLAYPIRKFEDGVYTRFLYDAESGVPQELERRIRLSDKVLRSLTVRLEDEWAEEAKVEAKADYERRLEEEERRREEEAQREIDEREAAEAKAAEAVVAEAKAAEAAAIAAAAPVVETPTESAPTDEAAPAAVAPAVETPKESAPTDEAAPAAVAADSDDAKSSGEKE